MLVLDEGGEFVELEASGEWTITAGTEGARTLGTVGRLPIDGELLVAVLWFSQQGRQQFGALLARFVGAGRAEQHP